MSDSKITKKDLVDAVYKSTDVEKQVIQTVVEQFLIQTRNALETGNTIELRGFGTFEVRLRKGRESARNPKTGEKCSSESHYTAVFRAGRELKENLYKLTQKSDKKYESKKQ